MSSALPTLSATDEAAIRAVVERLVSGWNQRDADHFATAFTDPHDYVVINGSQMLGLSRAENAATHTQVWQTAFRDGSEIAMEVSQVRFLTPEIAVAHATSENHYSADGTAREVDGSLTLVLTKDPVDGWRITAFHNGLKMQEPDGHLQRAAGQ